MRILQHNCNHLHAKYVVAFEGAKKVVVDIVCLEEPYIDGGVMAHPAYDI